MLNCILAVVVEAGAAAAAADEHDKAVQREKMVLKAEEKLIDLCQGLDSDSSGSLNIDEFLHGYRHNAPFRECLEVMHVTESDMFRIFNICDEDDSGDVDYREFVDQLRRIKHSGEQMLLHYVTDIRHQVNRIRPECLKPPIKKDEGGSEEKLDLSASGAPVALPAELAELSRVSDELDNKKMGADKIEMPDKEQKNIETNCYDFVFKEKLERIVVIDEDLLTMMKDVHEQSKVQMGILHKDKMERIFQINEDLVNIMTDIAQQSKVQTGLLNKLAAGGLQGGATRASTGGATTPRIDARESSDVVQITNAGGRMGIPGCCARVV